MNETSPPEQTLRHRFPLLWRLDATDPEFREDLERTDREFGSKWRRHKADRLAELQRHEDQLALAVARDEIAAARPVIDLLGLLAHAPGSLLAAVATTPIDAETAETVFRLSTIRLSPAVSVADHDLDEVLDDLSSLHPDDLGEAILREAIYPVGPPIPNSRLAKRFGITRQSVSERRRRLEDRLIELGKRRSLASLRDHLEGRTRHQATGPVLPPNDPFAGIARLDHEGSFPDVIDAVQAGLWLASRIPLDSRPPGFRRQPDDSLSIR